MGGKVVPGLALGSPKNEKPQTLYYVGDCWKWLRRDLRCQQLGHPTAKVNKSQTGEFSDWIDMNPKGKPEHCQFKKKQNQTSLKQGEMIDAGYLNLHGLVTPVHNDQYHLMMKWDIM